MQSDESCHSTACRAGTRMFIEPNSYIKNKTFGKSDRFQGQAVTSIARTRCSHWISWALRLVPNHNSTWLHHRTPSSGSASISYHLLINFHLLVANLEQKSKEQLNYPTESETGECPVHYSFRSQTIMESSRAPLEGWGPVCNMGPQTWEQLTLWWK